MQLDSQIKTEILDTLVTSEKALEFLRGLSALADDVFKNGNREKESEFAYLNTTFAGLLSRIGLTSFSQIPAEEEFLAEILAWLKDADVINVELAFEPRTDFRKKLYMWFKEKLHSMSLIAIKVVPENISGIIVAVNGKYIDLSLSKKLEMYFRDNKDEILSDLQE